MIGGHNWLFIGFTSNVVLENHLRSASICSHEHSFLRLYRAVFLTFRGWLICSICQTISLTMLMFSRSWFNFQTAINILKFILLFQHFKLFCQDRGRFTGLLVFIKNNCAESLLSECMLRSLLNLSVVFRTTEVKSTANVWCFWVENGRSGITGLHNALKDHFTAVSL